MTFPNILWGILWFVFRKHLLNAVAMVTHFRDTLSKFS